LIWHIFKKDWKLLYVPALLVVWLRAIATGLALLVSNVDFKADLPQQMSGLADLGSLILIAVLVRQEAIPGFRQDWLVRPIPRFDLLAAKLVFIVLTIHVPVLLASVTENMAVGFPFGESIVKAVGHNVVLLLTASLPMLAIASLVENFAQAACGVILMEALPSLGGLSRLSPPSGASWIPEMLKYLLILAASIAALRWACLQHRVGVGRRTFTVALCLCVLTVVLPWPVIFWIQKGFSPARSAGQIDVAFDAVLAKRMGGRGEPPTQPQQYVPLIVSGLPEGAILQVDHAEIHVGNASLGVDGSNPLQVRREANAAKVSAFHGIPAVVRPNERTSVGIDYSFSLLEVTRVGSMPPIGGDQYMPGVGRCVTRLSHEGKSVEFDCFSSSRLPSCYSVQLEYAGQYDPEWFYCYPDYAPWEHAGRSRLPPSSVDLYFHDPEGNVHYPVDQDHIHEAKVVMRTYEARDHFTRRIDFPSMGLTNRSMLFPQGVR
jgi:hypothetical protein